MKILSARQSKEADQYTIQHEPIASIDLMERAVQALYKHISAHFEKETAFEIYCGKGNNGGDGLGLARLLANAGYPVKAVIVEHSDNASDDFATNLDRLKDTRAQIVHLRKVHEWSGPEEAVIVVDAILGAGLSRPLEGFIREVVERLNKTGNFKIAIDSPTGLFADDNSENELDRVLRADWCLSIQFPKLSMMHKSTAALAGQVIPVDIGLHPDYLEQAETHLFYLQPEEVKTHFRARKKHSYKGSYGHAFLLAGSRGSMGAAIMSSMAALRSGTGLLTACVPGCGLNPIQTAVPEAMVSPDAHDAYLTKLPELGKATAIGAGPGLGTEEETAQVIKQLIQGAGVPLVFDADALNILSENKTWLSFLPANTILTPHPGEFKRLIGADKLGDDYLDQLREFSMKKYVITILKDTITVIADPRGNLYFMDEGSPALASPGSGDVLTGIILALLSSGYPPLHAAWLGVHLQGRAGTLAGELYSLESALARDVIDCLGQAFEELYS